MISPYLLFIYVGPHDQLLLSHFAGLPSLHQSTINPPNKHIIWPLLWFGVIWTIPEFTWTAHQTTLLRCTVQGRDCNSIHTHRDQLHFIFFLQTKHGKVAWPHVLCPAPFESLPNELNLASKSGSLVPHLVCSFNFKSQMHTCITVAPQNMHHLDTNQALYIVIKV